LISAWNCARAAAEMIAQVDAHIGEDSAEPLRRRPGPGEGQTMRDRRQAAGNAPDHGPLAAQTEAAAVAAAAQHSPDLILVDVTLKQGNGVSAMRTIARNEFDV